MASNVFSRFRPLADLGSASIYETIREHDEEAEDSDDLASPTAPVFVDEMTPDMVQTQRSRPVTANRANRKAGSKRRLKGQKVADTDEIEDDVPASLLIEDNDVFPKPLPPRPSAIASPPGLRARAEMQSPSPVRRRPGAPILPLHGETQRLGGYTIANIPPKERAMWQWMNVENLDNFLADVYDYYIFDGYWSIILSRILNLATVAFIVGFCLFLTQCIEYNKIRGSNKLDDIYVHRCTAKMGVVPNMILWVTTFVCVMRCFQYMLDLRRLNQLHNFYLYLLGISESEIQSISWQEVVGRLMALRDSNPNIRVPDNMTARRFLGTQSKQRMDAHDVANRLMRKDNYMVAMVSREVLDTTFTLPLLGKRQFFTKTLEWHLNYCIMDYVFNKQGQIRQLFLKDTHRKALSEGLRRRFVFAGTTSLIFAPILILYYIVQNFFQHFNEYQKDPARVGARQYSTFAQWKFREYNELWHLFNKRLKMSHPFATRYINRFPKDKTVQTARFVQFVSGAIVSILGLATILDQENFLSFEITPGRTTIFYLGVFGSIWAISRGLLPDDNMIHDSSYSMEEVIEFTHYKPAHWDGRLHTVEVKTEFEQLYQMQIIVLLEEILSMIFTPFVLWLSLPKCSDSIIDFFREFTVHVDGLGYVCSFAEFNFKKPTQFGTGDHAGTRAANPADVALQARNEYYGANNDDKLERSYWGFMNDYARNPKTDVRFPYSMNRGRNFSLPPPIPGLLSPTSPHQQKTPDPSSMTRGGRAHGSGPDEDVLPQSMLLDPHHQPGGHGSTVLSALPPRSRRAGAKSRAIPNLGDTMISTAVKEEDEDDEQAPVVPQPTEPTNAPGQSAEDLGSWKYEDDMDEESDGDEDPRSLAHQGGVLGLVRQFQKAHDDDKRSGAGV